MSEKIKVGKFTLDSYQMKLLEHKGNSLVIAGAGSGKTLTILGKVKYLIEYENINPNNILIISFTNASVNDIKSRINYDVSVYTFHKLAMHILEINNYEYSLLSYDLLEYITNEYLSTANIEEQKLILKFLKINHSYKSFLKSKEFMSFKNFITTFINLYKTNNTKKEDIFKIKYTKLEKKILLIIFNIYNLYLIEKNSMHKLDFDDLIINATKVVPDVTLNYKYIIIDEFQDTSLLRLNLIKAIYKNENAKIIVVGDDYQSIYHFSGCDLQIFLNFESLFPDVLQIPLVNTYRNSQELIDIAAMFVLKNPLQIKKSLLSPKHSNSPIILCPYKDIKEILKNVLDYLLSISDNIMILTRNNKDIYNYLTKDMSLDNNYLFYKEHKITYLTIHRSKGLEAEYVILLNCNNSMLGLPNKIVNNKIILKLFPDEKMMYAEERRLFYVGITRCKEQTFLIYDVNNPSIFIKEIKKYIKKVMHKITYFH